MAKLAHCRSQVKCSEAKQCESSYTKLLHFGASFLRLGTEHLVGKHEALNIKSLREGGNAPRMARRMLYKPGKETATPAPNL
jgi:hypothetical protein